MSGLLAAAIRYANAGISVIPAIGKKPSIRWESAQTRRAPIGQIQGWDQAGLLQNVAVVCGQVSGGLVILDCDGIEAIKLFKRYFPALADGTLAITSGSRRGAHYWFFCGLPTPTTRAMGIPGVGNIELRSEGTYTIAPPSIHPETGLAYIVRRSVKPMRVTTLLSVTTWIESLKASQLSAGRSSETKTGTVENLRGGELRSSTVHQGNKSVRDRIAYGRAALESEIAKLMHATTNQNDALYAAALKIGSHVHDGNITRHFAEAQLYQAAHDMGYVARDGGLAALKTIKSGLDTGEGNSRDENSSRQRA